MLPYRYSNTITAGVSFITDTNSYNACTTTNYSMSSISKTQIVDNY